MGERYTIVFEGDIRRLPFNPMLADDTKFGQVANASVGDVIADNNLMWDFRELGRAIYLGLYEHQGADWNANETQSVWYDVAARVLAVLHRDEPTEEAP